MKSLRFLPALSVAAITMLFGACGSGDKTETTTTDSSKTDSSHSTSAPASTIVTTTSYMFTATHKVKDFEKWRASFEAHDSMKLANGLHNYVLGRSVDDSSMILVALRSDDIAKAKAFSKDPSLKEAMQKGGVVSTPTFSFMEVVWQDTGTISATLRARSTFTVKDWDAWRKSFDSARALNTDNGLAVRVIGHDADDNKKVTIVTAILDSAKANAFWNSDEIKKRRAASGVVGDVKRFVFNVVKRY